MLSKQNHVKVDCISTEVHLSSSTLSRSTVNPTHLDIRLWVLRDCVFDLLLFYLIGLTLLGLLNFILFYFFLFFCSFEVIMQREGKGTCCALVGTFNGYGFTLIETRFWAVLVCLENLKCLCCPSTPKAFFFSFDVILCQCLHFFFPPLDEVYIANVQTNGIQNSDAVARWTPWCYRVSKPLVCVPVGLSWPAFVWNSDPSYTNKALQHVL